MAAERARELWDYTLFPHGPADRALDWPTAADYLASFSGRTPANVIPQVPHLAVRFGVMGWTAGPAGDDEIGRMQRIVRGWMEAGAVALNLGLDYQPSALADTRELVELSKAAAAYGGIYAAHTRYTDLGQAAAWRETTEIGRRADIPVHISHEHDDDVTEPLLEEAARTCDLTFESYLYPAGCTHLAMMPPTWAQVGGPSRIKTLLADLERRRALRDHLHDELTVGAGRRRAVFVATPSGRYIGLDLSEATATAGLPMGDFALRELEEEHPYALMVFHHGTSPAEQRDTVWRTVRHPKLVVASDGVDHGQSAHPRGYGCFARVLRRCVREMAALPLEAAIHKMTGFPAARFRLGDRGLIRPGYGADVGLFDPEQVANGATWEEPRTPPVGIDRVIVNGQTVVAQGRPTGSLPGRVLRRQA